MDLLIRASNASPTRAVEVVERKGLGHPDTICDGVAEEISRTLCKQYRDHFGIVLHHNVDKALLVGGNAHPQFGGGEVTEPMEIYLAGRATAEAEGKQIRVDEIAVEACRSWLRAHLPHVDLDRHVRIIPRIRAGSSALTALFARDGKGPVANDTSCGVGFAPLSDLERTVLAVERELNSRAAKRECPGIGEDIKVMGVRSQDKVTLTIGCAVVAKHVPSLASYKEVKNVVRERAVAAASAQTSLPVEALVNAADDLARGDVFLTVTGTSAESGDDGEVGRGNRVNGMITPYRPMTMEAASGKNPVNHVGKLYNIAANRIAQRTAALGGVQDATCMLVSQIGRTVADPLVVDVAVHPPVSADRLRGEVESLVRQQLHELPEIWRELVERPARVY